MSGFTPTLVLVMLAGMADRTSADLVCIKDNDGDYALGETDGKCSALPKINAAFDGEMSYCTDEYDHVDLVSRVCVCARCVLCGVHQVSNHKCGCLVR